MSEHIIRQIPRPERGVTPRKSVEPSALTAEELRELLRYDRETGIFTWKVRTSRNVKVGDVAGSPGGYGYLLISVQRRPYLAHRLAWLYVNGTWPNDQIDHINRIRTDNRISNLRDVSRKQNMQNRSKSSANTSGYTGVYWNKRISKWVATITHNYKLIYLGCFDDIEDALSARKAAEKLYWADTQTQ